MRFLVSARGKLGQHKAFVCRLLAVMLLVVLCCIPPLFINNIIGYAPPIALMLLLVALWIWVNVVSRNLTVSVEGDMVCATRGETAALKTTVRNASPLFVSRLDITFLQIDAAGNSVQLVKDSLSILPFEDLAVDYSLRCEHVGNFVIEAHTVRVYDPLRFFSKPIESGKSWALGVEPRLFDASLADVEWDNDTDSDDALAFVVNNGMDYTGVREYEKGDLLRSVHWKLSARFEEQLTRVYTQNRMPSVALVCDFSSAEQNGEERASMFDAIIESLFSFELFASRQGFDVRIMFMSSGSICSFDSHSDADYLDIMNRMPAFGASDNFEVIELLSMMSRRTDGFSNVVLITANPNEQVAIALSGLKDARRNPILVAICPRSIRGDERSAYLGSCASLSSAAIPVLCLADTKEFEDGGVYGLS